MSLESLVAPRNGLRIVTQLQATLSTSDQSFEVVRSDLPCSCGVVHGGAHVTQVEVRGGPVGEQNRVEVPVAAFEPQGRAVGRHGLRVAPLFEERVAFVFQAARSLLWGSVL